MRTKIIYILILSLCSVQGYAQRQKIKNQPFADQKIYHFGFTIGIHNQDLIYKNTGVVTPNGEAWFSEIAAYSPGFSVGLIADRYINQYMNVRVVPTMHFGSKEYTFKNQNSGAFFRDTERNTYITLPAYLKLSSERNNNIRPYVLGGAFAAMEVGRKGDAVVKLKPFDYGLEIGFGCDFYLPLFKFSPEIKFSFGLRDLIEKDRSDLVDKDLIKYTDAISGGTSRMVTVTFNFE